MPFTQHEEKEVVPLWVNGAAKALDPSRIFSVTSSAQSKVVHYAESASASNARDAADAAWDAFSSWRNSKYHQRRELLLRVADIFSERSDELAQWQVLETSCSEKYARFNHRLGQGLCWNARTGNYRRNTAYPGGRGRSGFQGTCWSSSVDSTME